MLKKTITYSDFDGNEVTEDFYFNLTKAEIAEMELSTEGGLSEKLQNIVEAADGKAIIEIFKDILRRSFGRRSEDSRRFSKDPAYFEEFLETEAYSVLFMELISDADKSAAFIRGIVPADLSDNLSVQDELPFAKSQLETKGKGKKPQDHQSRES